MSRTITRATPGEEHPAITTPTRRAENPPPTRPTSGTAHPSVDRDIARRAPYHKISVISVDDDPMTRQAIGQSLSRHPNITLDGTLSSGAEALEAIDDRLPNVMVVDVHMPRMSGVELARLARQSHPELPVIAYTAHTDHRTLLDLLAVGARGVVHKDTDHSLLLHAIHSVMLDIMVLSPEFATGFEDPAELSTLSSEGRAVLHLIAEGLSNQEIAAATYSSLPAVKARVAELIKLFEARNRTHLVFAALQRGLV
ncbi:MAG: response regulator transcription factor [Propionibacteriaceae bacterium]|jgi:two-component system nitrate/nitrite response regulator NarL|nr:response regulator transcription factor [Propionibacteriaceae bacterium]